MDTLINSMGTGTLGRISPYVLNEVAVPHSCVTLLRYKRNISLPCWLYRTVKHYEKIIETKGTGSTGQTSLNNLELGDMYFLCPKYSVIEQYENIVNDFYKSIKNNNSLNIKLKQLRDFLLPLLMNGQVAMQDAEGQVNNVIKTNKAIFSQEDERFKLWLQSQGLAARGDVDMQTLREIFDSMDEDDK